MKRRVEKKKTWALVTPPKKNKEVREMQSRPLAGVVDKQDASTFELILNTS